MTNLDRWIEDKIDKGFFVTKFEVVPGLWQAIAHYPWDRDKVISEYYEKIKNS